MIRENFNAYISHNEDAVTIFTDDVTEKLQGYTIAVSTNGSQTCHTPAMTRGELKAVYEALKAEFE